jgi:hypothetical protein
MILFIPIVLPVIIPMVFPSSIGYIIYFLFSPSSRKAKPRILPVSTCYRTKSPEFPACNWHVQTAGCLATHELRPSRYFLNWEKSAWRSGTFPCHAQRGCPFYMAIAVSKVFRRPVQMLRPPPQGLWNGWIWILSKMFLIGFWRLRIWREHLTSRC